MCTFTRNPFMIGCIFCLRNDRLNAGQKWPVIPGRWECSGGAAALPLFCSGMDTLSIALIVAIAYTIFQAIINNTNVVLILKGEPYIMSAIDQLLTYILGLTPDETLTKEQMEYVHHLIKALFS